MDVTTVAPIESVRPWLGDRHYWRAAFAAILGDERRDAFDAMVEAGRIERYSVTPGQVILYFREIRNEEPVDFAYELRAMYLLRVQAPSSSVYAYYEPSLRDETAPVLLSVE